jgi:hypothetical protein
MSAPALDGTRSDKIELNESIADFDIHGYVVLRDALSSAELETLRGDGVRLCRGDYGDIKGVTPADPAEPDDDVMRRYLCIHHPHKLSDIMLQALHQRAIVDAMTTVIGPDVKAMQSMLFMKSEGKPGQAWHQDEFFIPPGTARSPRRGSRWTTRRRRTAACGSCPGRTARVSSIPIASTTTHGSTARSSFTISRIRIPTRCRSRCRRARSWFSTATCCTGRCPTAASTDSAGRW